jgi:hypothetical protein
LETQTSVTLIASSRGGEGCRGRHLGKEGPVPIRRGAREWRRSNDVQSHWRDRRGEVEVGRRRGLRRGALARSLGGETVLASRLEVRKTETAPDALVEERLRGRRRKNLHGTALARRRRRLLLRGGDIGAAVGTPGAPTAVRQAGVADLAAVHQGAAQQASAEAVLGLQTAHTAARLDVGAHLHEGGGLAPVDAADGAPVEADTRGGRRAIRRLHTRSTSRHGLDDERDGGNTATTTSFYPSAHPPRMVQYRNTVLKV